LPHVKVTDLLLEVNRWTRFTDDFTHLKNQWYGRGLSFHDPQRNTRAAYARASWQFFEWCAANGLELKTVRPFHVAAWIEDFPGSKPTVKLKLAAVRMLYDFLVVRQITPSNPAHSVRGPK
jgi:site-specific recombinase XerD